MSDPGADPPEPAAPDAIRDARIELLFGEALEQPESDREAWLLETAGDDTELLAEVRSLLEAYRLAPGLLDSVRPATVARETFPAPDNLHEGGTLGPWRIIRSLASGGMGTVYLGERIDDSFRMQVAIKVLSARVVHPGLLTQFRNERQILADLDHPGIARLLDGGTTPDGTPYLVMEYVDGETILEAAKRRPMDVDARLRLFLAVAEAVQYAHANLVIHRDIKPGNIVVRQDGQPKLLDFGIARVFQPPGSPDAAETLIGTPWALTPRYASPEQIRGERVTTATDMYSLGVVLYQLLTGHFPHDVAGNSILDIGRVIDESPPIPPSHRREAPDARRLAGDLDTILLKALAREPARRYASVADFAEDVRRHLDGEPVLARADSTGYRIGRFMSRHRLLVGSVAAVVVTLIAALLVTLSFYQRAAESADASRWYAYTSTLAATESAIMNHNMKEARELLETLGPVMPTWEYGHLAARLDRSARRWHAHDGGITHLACSRDGGRLLSMGVDGVARLWQFDTGESLAAWSTGSAVESGAFLSGDGRVVLGLNDGRVVLATIGSARPESLGAGRSYALVDAHPDGQLVAAGYDDGQVVLYDAASRRELTRWQAHSRLPITAFSPDGRWLATGGADSLVKLWDARTGRLEATMRGHRQRIFNLAWSRDATRLVTGARDHTAIVWNVATGQPVSTFAEHRGTVGALAFHPDNRSLLSAGSEGRVMVWDATTGARTAEYHGHAADVSAVAVAPSGDWSVTGEWDGTIRIWSWGVDDVRVLDGRGVDLGPTRYLTLDVDPSSHLVVSTDPHDNVDIRELREGATILEMAFPRASTAVFIDTTSFVVGDETGRLRRILNSGISDEAIQAYEGPVVALAASPGTGRLASLGDNGRIRLWAVPGLEPVREWSARGTDVQAIAFDPTGTRLASGGADGLVRIWNPETGTQVDSLESSLSGVIQLALQPHGPLVVAATTGGSVLLLDPARSAPDTLLANGDAGLSVAFSRDGERVAVGSHDQLIYLFDVARRSAILRLHGHIARVSVVHFLPDGRTLLSASHDGTIRIWDSQ